MLFVLISRMIITYHIVKDHHHFIWFVWQHQPYQLKVLPFGLAKAPRIFTVITKAIVFLCHHKGLYVIIYLDDILVFTCTKHAGERAQTFLCSHGLSWFTY